LTLQQSGGLLSTDPGLKEEGAELAPLAVNFTLYGYAATGGSPPSVNWTTGNLGKAWGEGEWELTSVSIPPDPVGVPTPSSPLFSVRNYPNPFNPQTVIGFTLAAPQNVQIAVYDLAGHQLQVLADRSYTVGKHSVMWNGKDANGRDVPTGTYVVQVSAVSGVQMKKVMLIR